MLRLAYPLAIAASTSLQAAGMPGAAHAFELSLPIDCEPGVTCIVQNLVDADPGPGRRDALCGRATYDGHKGTDFRVPDVAAMRRGVDVLAAAPGRVLRVRDGETDGVRTAREVDGRECGNGLVIDHGSGWTTQYCHLARDSIRVAPGGRVERGQTIGRVGLSGRTEFPHVHLALRRDGRVVDPASGMAVEARAVARCASNGHAASLWDERAREAVRGDRTEVLAAAFAGGAVENALVVRSAVPPPARRGPLVLYAQFSNAEPGDTVRLAVRGPNGPFVEKLIAPLERHKATWTVFAGRRNAPPGRYVGEAILFRDGRPAARTRAEWLR